MAFPLVILIVLLSLILLLVGIIVIKHMVSTSSLDEELEEYEALLKGIEKRGNGLNGSPNPDDNERAPILTKEEVNSTIIPMTTDAEISKSLSDEELLKDVDSDDLA